MITRIGFAPRRPGLTLEQAQAHWGARHAEVMRPMPNLLRYWQNPVIVRDGQPLLPWVGFDCCSEFDFEDIVAHDQGFTSPEYLGPVREDELNLVDKAGGGGGGMMTRKLVEEGEPDHLTCVRLHTFMRLGPTRTAAELSAALMASRLQGGAQARTVYMALTGPESAMRFSTFDALEIHWFPNEQAASRYVTTEEARQHRLALSPLVRGTERFISRVRVIV